MLGRRDVMLLLIAAVAATLLDVPTSACLTCCAEPMPDGTCCCVHPGCPPIPPSCPPPTVARCGRCWNTSALPVSTSKLNAVDLARPMSDESAAFMKTYYSYRDVTRWADTVPLPLGVDTAGPINWVSKGAVWPATSQGRCATCQDFSCVADIEGAWFTSGHKLIKLSEQQMIDCGGGDAYGMKWVLRNGGIASGCAAGPVGHRGPIGNCEAPLANHSDPNMTGCRGVTDCNAANPHHAAYINGTTCLTNHVEENILALLQYGPMSVSIAASPLNGYSGGIINCSGAGIDHAVTLVAYGENATSGEKWWTIKNSWGPDFGESSPHGDTRKGHKGYARLKHGNLCLRGPCQAYVGKPPGER